MLCPVPHKLVPQAALPVVMGTSAPNYWANTTADSNLLQLVVPVLLTVPLHRTVLQAPQI